jgi:hypothetical protein
MTGEIPGPQDNIALAVEKHLNFSREGEDWLVKDYISLAGGSSLYEWLPGRMRISQDGTRYEISARRQDVEGLLTLTKTIGKNPQSVEKVLRFWDDRDKFTAYEEGEWIYLQTEIEPTVEGFEREYMPLRLAYDLAIAGAVEGKTWRQLRRDKKHKSDVERALDPGNAMTALFGQLDDKFNNANYCTPDCGLEKPFIIAETLEDFPLLVNLDFVDIIDFDPDRIERKNFNSLEFAPGRININGEQLERRGISLQAYNGYPLIEIYSSDNQYDHDKGKWLKDTFRVNLEIPAGDAMLTIKDMENLRSASIEREGDRGKIKMKIPVNVIVSEDKLVITAENGQFSMEIDKPACYDCGIPSWKFPQVRDTHGGARVDFGGFFQLNSSLGIDRFISNFEDKPKTYCANCIDHVVETYVSKHEYAKKEWAMDRALAELREMGYQDVEVFETWRIGNGWMFHTWKEYEREGKLITRFTGNVTLDDDGDFTSELQPREFVEFRHQY